MVYYTGAAKEGASFSDAILKTKVLPDVLVPFSSAFSDLLAIT